jgi:cardiolipin synthase
MQKIPAPVYTVLRGEDLIRDVSYETARAKHFIWAQCMDYEPGDVTDRFTSIFSKAAERGLDAKLNIDYYPLLMTDGDFNYLPIFNKEKAAERKRRILTRIQAIHNLRDMNVDIHLLNKPGLLESIIPTKGRNHIKIIIVDNFAWVGGINFHDFNFLCDDFMVKLTGKHLIAYLKQLYMHMHDNQPIVDITTYFNKDAKLMLDSGKPGKSVILDEAIKLVNTACTSVDFSSAFFPDGNMLSALYEVTRRGVRVRAVVPQFETVKGISRLVDISSELLMKIENKKIPVFFNNRKMHSKFIIVDNATVIFGSHNFSQRGVTMGTAELAVESTNPSLVRNIRDFFHYLLTGTDAMQ